ncbi:SdpI family protein [Candidatus Micrarchaeota archaeon]|nr:SdpI family protein [Candidatus Micrarchaeota archaeon]
MRAIDMLSVSLVIIAFLLAIGSYGNLPDRVPTHWDISGKPDKYDSREMGAFLIPGIMVVLFVLWEFIPRIAVFKKNFKAHMSEYKQFRAVFLLFFLLVYGAMLAPHYGIYFHMGQSMLIGIGLLFLYIGQVLPRFKRNFFVGIRTPWAIASDEVWKKTHILGGKVFKVLGVIMLLSLFLDQKDAFLVMMASILVGVFGLFVYSYLEYRKMPASKRNNRFQ